MSPAIGVRERPPLRLHASIDTPSGAMFRWAPDEDAPANAPSDLTFSTTIPGGFDQCSLTLPRRTDFDYADLAEFATVSILGLGGGRTAWEGRLERVPRTSGDKMSVSPGMVGWQAHLDDNKNAREIYVDIDLSHWQGPTTDRISQLQNLTYNVTSSEQVTGAPALKVGFSGDWSTAPFAEGWYDAKGIPLAAVYGSWSRGYWVNPANTHWHWHVLLGTDDTTTAEDGGELRASGPGVAGVTTTAGDRTWALVQTWYDSAPDTGHVNDEFVIFWTCLAAYGRTGVPGRGSQSAYGAYGMYASDVVTHVVGKYAPLLAMTRGGSSTITGSNFIIPHLTFLEPTTASDIVKQANKYELYDWCVWEGPTFWYYPRGTQGRNWRARIGPSQLSEAGPQVDQIWNGVVVGYNDTNNIARTVGPPGSGANTEDAKLVDTDPQNPANTIPNLKRWTSLQMNTVGKNPDTGTPDAAIRVGQLFLAQQKQANTSGDATLVGHVEDDRGVLWPSWMVRAGDTITFVDARTPVARRIVRTEYSDATKSCHISLDAPPESLQVYLDRLSVSLQPLGFQ